MGQEIDYTERRVASFLLRFWMEPREAEGEEPVFRGYIRHLQTGEEAYLTDPEAIIELVRRWLASETVDSVSSAQDEPLHRTQR